MARKLRVQFLVSESTFPGGNEKGQRCSALAHRTTSRREVESRSSGLESSEARQKFAGAKAISSDMFFGREVDSEYEARSRLQQLSGSSAISSSDLFGDVDGAHGGGRASVLSQTPNEHS